MGARLCSECGSYQDWRGYLNVSSTVLALLVALVSVATAAVPVAYRQFGLAKSRVVVGTPATDSERIRVVISNVGDAPAVLHDAALRRAGETLDTNLEFRDPRDAFLDPGSKFIELNIPMNMSAAWAYKLSDEYSRRRPNVRDQFRVNVLHSDGKKQTYVGEIDNEDMEMAYAAHGARCEDNQRPSYANGCKSLGEELHLKGFIAVTNLQNGKRVHVRLRPHSVFTRMAR
jgi:hypothetical protein